MLPSFWGQRNTVVSGRSHLGYHRDSVSGCPAVRGSAIVSGREREAFTVSSRWVAPIAIVAAASLLAAPIVSAQVGSLSTGYEWLDGWCAGLYIDLTASVPVTVTSFDVYFRGTLNRDVSVYYKAGTYVGSETTPGAWSLPGTVNVTPGGDGTATAVNLGGVAIPAGETYAFYFWDHLGTGGADGGGLILGKATTYSNADLTLTTTSYNCDSAFQTPTTCTFGWEGTLYYQRAESGVPALDTTGLVGLAALVVFLGWVLLRQRSAALGPLGQTRLPCLPQAVNTLRALEDGLDQFAGCVVVISHDRWFLDRIATHILAFEGESMVTFFDGDFTEYEEWRKKQLGDATTRPHRITYRKLTR